MVEAIWMVFDYRGISEEWKKMMITLIPKLPDASTSAYFKLISLCITLYKICAKVLVGQLNLIVSHLISSKHDAFVSS